jgi:cytochrome P450
MADLDFGTLQTLGDVGFIGGRDGLRPFAERIFSSEEPRFLRTDSGELVVFRNRDLQRMGSMPEIGNVPPAILFGEAAYPSKTGEPVVGAELARVIMNQVFTANDPIHKPTRKALVSRLGPKQTRAMKPIAQKVVDRILDAIDIAGPVEIVERIAERLTCGFWGAVLDMNDDEVIAMQHHTQGLTRLFHFERKLEDFLAIDEAAKGYREVIVDAVRRCVARGDNEFVSMMAADLAQINFEDDLEEA